MMLRKWLLLGLLCLSALAAIPPAAAENVTLCWGDGSFGELGDGKGDSQPGSHHSSVPVEVLGGHSFAAVCAGGSHSCGLERSGQAWCWGSNMGGQLGDNTITNYSAMPVEVAGGHIFRSITCGGSHSCALDIDGGKAWCWGDNSWGQLAAGGETYSTVPVEAAAGRTFEALSAGTAHTCGIDSGQAFCWGDNIRGELGNNTTRSSARPVAVAGGRTFRSITCGYQHTCALDDSSKAWCWGGFHYDQLGSGADDNQLSPVPVSGDRTFSAIAAGLWHTCAIAETGSTWCWGESPANGQATETRVAAEVGGGHTFVAVNAEGGFTCGLDTWGDAWCFGLNDIGQLGDGSNANSATPVKSALAGGLTFLSLGHVSAYGQHTCAIATRQSSPGGASSSSSSPSAAPVGAIFGGFVGATVVVAVVTFFALRPSKGWLRRKPSTAAAGAMVGGGSWGKEKPTPGSYTAGSSAALGGQQANVDTSAAPPPAAAASPLQAAWTSSSLGQDTFLPYSCAPPSSLAGPDTFLPYSRAAGAPPISQARMAAPTEPAAAPPSSMSGAGWPAGQPTPQPLPPSYISSAGLPTTPAAGGAALAGLTASHSSGSQSIASDPVLSFVTSHLGAPAEVAAQQQQPTALTPGSSGGGSGAIELRSEARVWEVQWTELKLQRLLGRGSFGSVYLAEWNQVPVAVKMLGGKDGFDLGNLELPDWLLQELQAEAAVMSRIRHPNIVQFMGLVAVPPAIITEYCSRGSLYDCLAAARKQASAADQLTWRRRLGMAIDAGAGLLYLHKRSIIHRDIKSPNLLVDEHWRVKVADFNLSKLLEGPHNDTIVSSMGANNPIWLAPEVLEGHRATAASEVYSFGMVLYELLTWRLPWTFANMTPFKVGATIRQGGRPEVPPRQALPGPDTAAWAGLDAYVQLMRDCWAQQPADRPSFDAVVGRLRRLLADTAGFHLDRLARRPPWR